MSIIQAVLLVIALAVGVSLIGALMIIFVFMPLQILFAPLLDKLMDKYIEWEDSWCKYWKRKSK